MSWLFSHDIICVQKLDRLSDMAYLNGNSIPVCLLFLSSLLLPSSQRIDPNYIWTTHTALSLLSFFVLLWGIVCRCVYRHRYIPYRHCAIRMLLKTLKFGAGIISFSLSDNPAYICGLVYSYRLGGLSWLKQLKIRNKLEKKYANWNLDIRYKLSRLFWGKITDILKSPVIFRSCYALARFCQRTFTNELTLKSEHPASLAFSFSNNLKYNWFCTFFNS